MKSYFCLLLFLLPFISTAQTTVADSSFVDDLTKKQQEAVGKSFPSFLVVTKEIVWNNQKLQGKKVFINFWFEACPPCVTEFDALNELYTKLKNKKGILFLSFTFESEDKLKELRRKYNIHYPTLSITRPECYRLNQNLGFPTNLILTPKGKIEYISCGGPIDKAEAREVIMREFHARLVHKNN